MNRCTKCILPEHYPNINFDEHGVCNYCREHVAVSELKDEYNNKRIQLEGIIENAKRKRIEQGGIYDVIVPLSGGKDSAYVAYVLKKEFGLSVLALTYDNGFLSNYSKENVWRIATKLDIDLEVLKPKWSLMQKLFAAMMRETNEFCNVCNSMGYLISTSYATRMAKAWGHLPLTVLGWVRRYEAQPGIQAFTIGEFLEIMKKQGVYDELIENSMIDKNIAETYLKIGDPRRTDISQYKQNTGFDVIQLADYIDWDLKYIIETLKRELDWYVPDGVTRATHFDCDAAEVKEFLKYKKWGITQKQITSSHLIRDGRLSREEGLELALQENGQVPEYWDKFLEKLELNEAELQLK